jgi:hypothetical protein
MAARVAELEAERTLLWSALQVRRRRAMCDRSACADRFVTL